MADDSRVIRTYMSFGLPVDPSNVKTLVDLDLSYALASTLIDWSDSRNLSEGLAKPVESSPANEIVFKLRPQAKWSDGSAITAAQVVKSFERAKRLHGNDLKSLFDIVEKIEAKDNAIIVFHLNKPAATSQILHKLTEPMYGIVFVRNDGSADLGLSSGPFILKSASANELVLVANHNWYGHDEQMAETIFIRQPGKANYDENTFLRDPWPNLITSSSLMPIQVASRYKKEHFSIWNRNLDRSFFLSPGARLANAEGRSLFQALNEKLNRKELMHGLSGYHLSQQFFPPGYVLFNPEFKPVHWAAAIPSKFKEHPLELLAAEGRIDSILKHNLAQAMKQLTGHLPKFRIVPLAEFNKERAAGHYDILVASLPVNDPNVEGAVSFIFEMNPPLIPNAEDGSGDFRKRILRARSLDEYKRNAEYRKVFSQAVQDGCLLPLFYFSSMVVARDGIDLSRVPTSDETVAFSKVRFK